MSTLGRTRLRLAADAASFDAPLDVLRRATPQFWRGNDVQFELAVFFNGALIDVSNLASLTLEVRPLGSNGQAPDPSFAPLMGATITTFDNTTTLDDWNAGAKQHAVVVFTATQSNIAAGAAWLSIFAITNDSPGRVITLCAGPVRVLEDGAGLATTPTPTADTFYTAAESDARFAAIGAGGEGAPASTSNPLMDATAAPGTATSYARADHVHPTDTSRAPLASPGLTGTPTAPTVGSATDNSTKIATTAFVQAAIAAAGGGGGGAWGGITGTLASQTDLQNALNLKATLASPALTGTPTAPTVGSASDNTTKIATTAFVQAAIANSNLSITTDGSGHYLFGGGSYYTYPGPTKSVLTVNGSFAVQSPYETAFVNNTAHGVAETGWNVNTISIQTTDSDRDSAIRIIGDDGYEDGAVGRGNSTNGGPWQGYTFMSTSPGYDLTTSTPHYTLPGGIGLIWEGKIGGGDGTAVWYRRMEINPDGSVNFNYPTSSFAGTQPQFSLNTRSSFAGESTNLNAYGYYNQGSTQYNLFNDVSDVAGFALYGSAFSYHGYRTNSAAVLCTGAGGLSLVAANAAGVLTFLTGGDLAANEWLRIDASGNFIASNVVTSAPAATLANGQYQFCVYDNAGTATLRVRYKNSGGTIKTGDLALS
jgi:hypothetical protein